MSEHIRQDSLGEGWWEEKERKREIERDRQTERERESERERERERESARERGHNGASYHKG